MTAPRIKQLIFALLLCLVAFGRQSLVSAAYFNCFASSMTFVYYGQEVECNASYQQNMCEAGCDYCFHTGCIRPDDCEAGTFVSGDCNNPI
jgi:hypothetical protein